MQTPTRASSPTPRRSLRSSRRKSRPQPRQRLRPLQTRPTPLPRGRGDAEKKICFHFRDHGNCPKKDSCPYSHDKELRKRALAARRDAGHQQTLATTKGGGKAGGKGGGKNGKPKAKAKAKAKAKSKAGAKPPGTVCPFFAKNGSCRKGANCDMVHSLATTGGNQVALPSNWGTAPSSASMSNPFAAFSIQIGSAGVQAGVLAAGAKGAESLAGGVPAAGSLPLREVLLCGRAASGLVAPR